MILNARTEKKTFSDGKDKKGLRVSTVDLLKAMTAAEGWRQPSN